VLKLSQSNVGDKDLNGGDTTCETRGGCAEIFHKTVKKLSITVQCDGIGLS